VLTDPTAIVAAVPVAPTGPCGPVIGIVIPVVLITTFVDVAATITLLVVLLIAI
jgi:hypothetical protein